mgnify:CR=1 FL=1
MSSTNIFHDFELHYISTISNKKPSCCQILENKGVLIKYPIFSRHSGVNETKILQFLDVSANFRKPIQKCMSGKQGGSYFMGFLIRNSTDKIFHRGTAKRLGSCQNEKSKPRVGIGTAKRLESCHLIKIPHPNRGGSDSRFRQDEVS